MYKVRMAAMVAVTLFFLVAGQVRLVATEDVTPPAGQSQGDWQDAGQAPGTVESIELPAKEPAPAETPVGQTTTTTPANSGFQTATIPVGNANVYITTDKIVITGVITQEVKPTETTKPVVKPTENPKPKPVQQSIPIAGLTKAEVAAALVLGLKPYATLAQITAAKQEILDSIGQLPNRGDLEDAKQEILLGLQDLAKEQEEMNGKLDHLHNYDWLWSLWNAFLITLAVLLGLFLIAALIGALLRALSRIFGWGWPGSGDTHWWNIFCPWCWWRRPEHELEPEPEPELKPEPELEIEIPPVAKPIMTNSDLGGYYGEDTEPATIEVVREGSMVTKHKGYALVSCSGGYVWAAAGSKQTVKAPLGATVEFGLSRTNNGTVALDTEGITLVDEFDHHGYGEYIPHSGRLYILGKDNEGNDVTFSIRPLSDAFIHRVRSREEIHLSELIKKIPAMYGRGCAAIVAYREKNKPTSWSETSGPGQPQMEGEEYEGRPAGPLFDIDELMAEAKEKERQVKEAERRRADTQGVRYGVVAKVRREMGLPDDEQENLRLVNMPDFSEERVRTALLARQIEDRDAGRKGGTGGEGGIPPIPPQGEETAEAKRKRLIKESATRQNVSLTDHEVDVLAEMKEYNEADVDKYVSRVPQLKKWAEETNCRLGDRDIYKVKYSDSYFTEGRVKSELKRDQIQSKFYHAYIEAGKTRNEMKDRDTYDLRPLAKLVTDGQATEDAIIKDIKAGLLPGAIILRHSAAKLPETTDEAAETKAHEQYAAARADVERIATEKGFTPEVGGEGWEQQILEQVKRFLPVYGKPEGEDVKTEIGQHFAGVVANIQALNQDESEEATE